jgi:hypothetical protein
MELVIKPDNKIYVLPRKSIDRNLPQPPEFPLQLKPCTER